MFGTEFQTDIYIFLFLLHSYILRVLILYHTCCILRCLVCIVVVVLCVLLQLSCVYCCSCLVCIVVVIMCVLLQLSCVYYSCLVRIVVVVLCVLLSSYVYLLYYVCIAVFYFRCRTAGYKSVFGRSCDRPPRHRFFLVSLCL